MSSCRSSRTRSRTPRGTSASTMRAGKCHPRCIATRTAAGKPRAHTCSSTPPAGRMDSAPTIPWTAPPGPPCRRTRRAPRARGPRRRSAPQAGGPPQWSAGPRWTYGPTGGGASGATIADLDNDGRLDIVFGGTDGYVYCLDDHGNLKWRTLVASGQSVPFTPQVADVDHSGRLSVVVSTNAPSVVRFNATGSIIWTYSSASVLFTTPALVDVNGDGVLDALVGSNSRNLAAIDGRTGTPLPSYSVPVAAYTPTIADIDANGAPEILVDGDDKNMHAFALDGTQLWAANVPGGSFLEGSIAFGDVNGDGSPEVVTGDVSNNGVELALWASNGTTAWYRSLPTYRQGGQTMADVNGDGIPEILLGVTSGTVYNLRGTDGSIFWSYNAGTTQAGTPVVADFDRSGTRQIAFIEGPAVDILTATGFLANRWTICPPDLDLRHPDQFPTPSPPR